ncbi:hypothetical protein AYR56_07295 [Loigolactobacillus backii]|uniref:Bifunctional metallophosphatase/5'-nucleotidase n=1 Tax=Loigolactobacillus backii TaxID=375175 RepID=A0A192H467_9LACO|nr:bifunctional metallophosphatase/5'-nucleotidase [Loigolactobacillus backii]ANK63012.1 hypothetical protein AYR53_09710 [Loigolactobacillus backii]ANK69980.1 hypothetical protein AYR56_07295 [Loigolactobacillus backii]
MKLTLLTTSDIHGYLYPTDYRTKQLAAPFGLVRAAAVIKAERKAAPGPVLTIETGDFLQGSPLAYYIARQKRPVAPENLTQAYNEINYDVQILGNHEFNFGRSYLQQALASLTQPVLCANILTTAGKPAFGSAYKLFDCAGVTVAVLGLTTAHIPFWETPRHIQGLNFQSIVTTAKQYVPKLRQLADVVVVAYHGGFEADLKTGQPVGLINDENEGYRLLGEVRGIDALVTGHQHRSLASHVLGVPIVQPGYRGSAVGKIQLNLATKPLVSVTASAATLLPTAKQVSEPRLVTKMWSLQQEAERWLDQPLGQVKGDMRIKNPNRARVVEAAYVEFIQRVQMTAVGADISATALFNNESTGFGEQVTMRQVVTNYVYPNTVALVAINGAILRAALEKSALFFAPLGKEKVGINAKFLHPKKQYYNYDMYEGIDYTINVARPKGQRITRLEYHGRKVLPTDQLKIALNGYRAGGGGNFTMFNPSLIEHEVQREMPELIADYFKAHPVVTANVNHNFNVINEPD